MTFRLNPRDVNGNPVPTFFVDDGCSLMHDKGDIQGFRKDSLKVMGPMLVILAVLTGKLFIPKALPGLPPLASYVVVQAQ